MKLHRIAHARAGDKGESNNICLFPYDKCHYELIKRKVTAEVVKEHFRQIVSREVIRYEIPSLHGFNFLLQGVRKDGVSATLDLDSHGKSLAFGLLELEIEVD
ncbi:MAG: hypothetical protein JRH18_10205 [Deltaproteobacteria bacterium]|nr:hypothetical protein [Deltaproteobacteria bacterium]MBW1960184.1 hypothetical protein [Deltaproteobacteria bacterium]MBW2152027.1 hypothetical protein [Deltaproteobacteria bacterium]